LRDGIRGFGAILLTAMIARVHHGRSFIWRCIPVRPAHCGNPLLKMEPRQRARDAMVRERRPARGIHRESFGTTHGRGNPASVVPICRPAVFPCGLRTGTWRADLPRQIPSSPDPIREAVRIDCSPYSDECAVVPRDRRCARPAARQSARAPTTRPIQCRFSAVPRSSAAASNHERERWQEAGVPGTFATRTAASTARGNECLLGNGHATARACLADGALPGATRGR